MVRLIIAVLLWGVAHSSTAQSFSEYRVPIRFHGKPARPQMNTVQSRRFRTQIREAVAVGPNFADHYTVAIWGCGSSCAMLSIINDLDGSVYDFPYSVVWTWEADYGVNFRRHSRAIHVVGQLNE